MQDSKWWAEGDLLDACNCELLCPCHISFRQKATFDTCQAIWGIHIERGEWDQIVLDGLNALVVALSGQIMFEGNWTALLFIDDRATPQQQEALTAIYSGTAGGPWSRLTPFFTEGKFKAVNTATFDFVKEDRARRIKVSDFVSLEIKAIRGVDQNEDVTLANLRNVIHGNPHILGRSDHQVNHEAIQWDNAGKHGLYSTFSWSGP